MRNSLNRDRDETLFAYFQEELAQLKQQAEAGKLDNASIHRAKVVQQQEKIWRKRGLFLQFIPAYSPELNLIEILWKRLKHSWLKPVYYHSMDRLIEATDYILQRFGQQYSIQFQ